MPANAQALRRIEGHSTLSKAPSLALSAEAQGLRAALSQPLPEIPPVYFYDDAGSELFERITRLPVYYPTRTELGILEQDAGGILAAARPQHLVELGSGAGRKIRLLLEAWPRTRSERTCTMLDINELFLKDSLHRLGGQYPELRFRGVVGDFSKDLKRLGPGGQRMIVFFGGTLGNLYPDGRRAFFSELAQLMEPSDTVLLGVDLIKDVARLEAAYNDPQGVTAQFNLNALHVMNQRFGANFEVGAFQHRAFYDERNAWIEMRLVAARSMHVHLEALGLELEFAAGSELRTEVSCKFTRASLEAAAQGLTVTGWYTDPEQLFALALLRKSAG